MEDEEAAKAEFSLVVEELWRRVERRWEESEWLQDQRWAAMMMALGHITDNVRELLDGLVPEEKEKGKEKETEDMETEVEEMLKEVEKSADKAERVEKDVIEE